jgi:hypothetical protein
MDGGELQVRLTTKRLLEYSTSGRLRQLRAKALYSRTFRQIEVTAFEIFQVAAVICMSN